MENVILSIPEQIKIALDGRTQRWLSFEVRITEIELSKKMNDVIPFTDEDIAKINERLSANIKKD